MRELRVREGTVLWPPRPAPPSLRMPSTATCLAEAPLTHQPPCPQRRVKISHTPASTCLWLVLIWISTHLCPHHGSSWLPHSGGCLGARRPFLTGRKLDLLYFSGRGVCEPKCQPVGRHSGPCLSVFHRLQLQGGVENTGRKGLGLAEPLEGALQVENGDTKRARTGPGTRAHPVCGPHSSLGYLFTLHLNPGGHRGPARWGSSSHQKLDYYSATTYYPPPATVHRVHTLPPQVGLGCVTCSEQEILMNMAEQRLERTDLLPCTPMEPKRRDSSGRLLPFTRGHRTDIFEPEST